MISLIRNFIINYIRFNIYYVYIYLKQINIEVLFFRHQNFPPPLCKSSVISKLPVPTAQQQDVCMELPKEEKSPVVCRVLQKSDKDNYQMYDIFLI